MEHAVFTTERLILRGWELSDAQDMLKYASDPDVGPAAGWPPHKDIEESRFIISNVLNGKEAYAICFKEDNRPIGTIELKTPDKSACAEGDDECELGFWLGKPFWGQGIMPEAARELIRHAFEDLGMSKVWCAHFEDNAKSQRTQEKMGFKPYCVRKDVDIPLLGRKTNDHVNLMTREDWEKIRG